MNNSYSVLVLDDDPDILSQIKGILKNIKIDDITLSVDPQYVLDILDKRTFDLAIIDLRIPQISGPAVLQHIRNHSNSEVREMSILVLCGVVKREEAIFLGEFGLTEHIFKPLQAAHFEKKVLEMLTLKLTPSSDKVFFTSYKKALDSNDFTQAQNLLFPKLKLDPKNLRYLLLYSELLLAQGDATKSEEIIDKIFDIDPNYLPGLNLFSRMLIQEERYDEALQILEKAKSISPFNIKRLLVLGELYLGKGNHQKAETQFSEVLNLHPEHQQASRGLGKSLLEQGRVFDSKEVFSKINKNWEMASFFNNKGILYIHSGKYKQGIHLYENALKVMDKSDKQYLLFYNVALAYYKLGNIAMARNYGDKCKEIAPHEYTKLKLLMEKLKENSFESTPVEGTITSRAPIPDFLLTKDQVTFINGKDDKQPKNSADIPTRESEFIVLELDDNVKA
jgi:tetratricopeptide (TPR) repeat protein